MIKIPVLMTNAHLEYDPGLPQFVLSLLRGLHRSQITRAIHPGAFAHLDGVAHHAGSADDFGRGRHQWASDFAAADALA